MSRQPLRLAAAAVAGALSLALTAPVLAAPLAEQVPESAVVLFSQSKGVLSGASDGVNTTVRLEALGARNVASVRFEYEFQDVPFSRSAVATVSRNDDGAFAHEWDPSVPNGSSVVLRAVALDAAGKVVGEDERTVEVKGVAAVDLASGATKGYFVQKYAERDDVLASVSGSTATSTGQRQLTLGFQDPVTRELVTSGTKTTASGPFTVPLDLTRYKMSDTGNQVVVSATLASAADDVEAFTLHEQAITTITAVADRSAVVAGETAGVTVTVLDQSDQPVVGAEVFQAEPSGTGLSRVGEPQYTDARGVAVFAQPPGKSYAYYANTDDNDTFVPGGTELDKRSGEVKVAVVGKPSQLAATSADGNAFDLDEVDNAPSQSTGMPPLSGTQGDGDATDVTVQVQDAGKQAVAPAEGQRLGYYWTVTPFAGGASTRYPTSGTSAATHEGAGLHDITVPSGGNGVYELFAELGADPVGGGGQVTSTKVLTVKAGQAGIVWGRTSPEKASAGSSHTATGRLALPDGTTLPGRALDLTFQRDTTSTTNEDATPDAGFAGPNATITTSRAVTTDGNGRFSAPLVDPAESPQLSELGDNIDARSASNDRGNAGATLDDHVVDFVHDPTPTALQLSESREGATTRAGEFTLYTARVVNAHGGGVAGQTVTLTTDRGYFSKPDGTASAPTATSTSTGSDVGSYRNDGTSVTLTTGADGTARVFLAVGREAGFDDDGAVQTTVTGSTGTFRASDLHAWTSANPLNGGTVTVVPSDRDQDSAILPDAQTVDEVRLDVVVTDGFGNPVPGEAVTLSDDSSAGSIKESDGTADDGRIVSDLDRSGDVVLTSSADAAQKLTATWVTETTTYRGSPSAPTTGTETLAGAYAVRWYAVDREASTYEMTTGGPATRPVGSAVTVTYRALDQKGQPVEDLFVLFNRTGPAAASGSSSGLTGADGTLTYTFVGTEEGRTTVVATAREGDAAGAEVREAVRSQVVTFGEEGPRAVGVRLQGRSNGRAADRLAVRTDEAAAGAVVKLFRLQRDGDRVRVGRGVVSSAGTVRFTVRDGRPGPTTYVARLLRNDAVRAATSNRRTLR